MPLMIGGNLVSMGGDFPTSLRSGWTVDRGSPAGIYMAGHARLHVRKESKELRPMLHHFGERFQWQIGSSACRPALCHRFATPEASGTNEQRGQQGLDIHLGATVSTIRTGFLCVFQGVSAAIYLLREPKIWPSQRGQLV